MTERDAELQLGVGHFLYNTQTNAVTLVYSGDSDEGNGAVISGNGQFIASDRLRRKTSKTYVVVTDDSGTF